MESKKKAVFIGKIENRVLNSRKKNHCEVNPTASSQGPTCVCDVNIATALG